MMLPIVLLASVIGAVVGIGMKFSGALREGRYVPFGPFLAGGGSWSSCSPARRACSAGSAGPDDRRRRCTPLRIGLTGGIGSGKSTVAAMLARHGATLVDTDAIARALTLPGGAAIAAIRATFGADVHRRRRRPRPRAHARARRSPTPQRTPRLEAILHPLIGAEASAQAAPRRPGASGLRHAAARRIGPLARARRSGLVVDCSEATQIERVMRALRLDATTRSRAVIAQQATRALRGARPPTR